MIKKGILPLIVHDWKHLNEESFYILLCAFITLNIEFAFYIRDEKALFDFNLFLVMEYKCVQQLF